MTASFCHCEERSDEAISVGDNEIATHLSDARNDKWDGSPESNDDIAGFGGLPVYYSIYRLFYRVPENFEKILDSARGGSDMI